MPEAERKVSFFAQAVWKRAAIVVAGPIANFILAIVIFTGIFAVHGRGIIIPRVDKVAPGRPPRRPDSSRATSSFRSMARRSTSLEDMQRIVQVSSDVPLTFVVARQGKDVTLVATPRRAQPAPRRSACRMSASSASRPRRPKPTGTSSATASSNPSSSRRARPGSSSSRRGPSSRGLFSAANRPINCRGRLASPRFPVKWPKSDSQRCSILPRFCRFRSASSISCRCRCSMAAIWLYYAVEAVRGKAMNEKIQQMGFRLGLAFVLGLMILATFNDILQLTK